MKSKLILSFLLLVVISPFSKAEKNLNSFKIPDSQIQFEVKDDDSTNLGGIKLHNFTITCKKSVLELVALQGKEKVHNHPVSQERTININIPSVAMELGEKAYLILQFPPKSLLGNYNMATFDVEEFDSTLSLQDPSKVILSHLCNEWNQPIDNVHDQPYVTANALGESRLPFSISEEYEGVDFFGLPYIDKYTLHVEVVLSVNAPTTTERTSE